nr:hypothetical protein [Tanacetum cinerariifolium]
MVKLKGKKKVKDDEEDFVVEEQHDEEDDNKNFEKKFKSLKARTTIQNQNYTKINWEVLGILMGKKNLESDSPRDFNDEFLIAFKKQFEDKNKDATDREIFEMCQGRLGLVDVIEETENESEVDKRKLKELIYETIEAKFESILKEKRELEDMLKENMKMHELFYEDEKFELFVKKFKEEFTTILNRDENKAGTSGARHENDNDDVDYNGHCNDEDDFGHANHEDVHANGNDEMDFAKENEANEMGEEAEKLATEKKEKAEKLAATKKKEAAEKSAKNAPEKTTKEAKEKAEKEVAKEAEREKIEAAKKNKMQAAVEEKLKDKMQKDAEEKKQSPSKKKKNEMVFDDGKGTIAQRKEMQSLAPGIEIEKQIIDTLVTVLNYKERIRTDGKDFKRRYFSTDAVADYQETTKNKDKGKEEVVDVEQESEMNERLKKQKQAKTEKKKNQEQRKIEECPMGYIVITPKTVKEVLGLPMGRRKLEREGQREYNDPFLEEWKDQFKNINKLTIKALSDLIIDTKHTDYMFRMNILTLIANILESCENSSSLKFTLSRNVFERDDVLSRHLTSVQAQHMKKMKILSEKKKKMGLKSKYVNKTVDPVVELTEDEKLLGKSIFSTQEEEEMNIQSLVPGLEIETSVIDVYVSIHNYEENFKTTNMKRHFFYTSMMVPGILEDKTKEIDKKIDAQYDRFHEMLSIHMKNDVAKMQMEDVELAFFPIIAHGHYYLIVFNLKTRKLVIIDNNESDATYEGKYKDNVEFVRSVFGRHMFMYQNTNADKILIGSKKATILKMKWRTTKEKIDSGLYMILHMELYERSSATQWKTGLLPENDKNHRMQMDNLRLRIVAKILLHEVNIYAKKMSDYAKKMTEAGEGGSNRE